MKYKLSEKITGVAVIVIRKLLFPLSLKMRYRIFEGLGILGYHLIKKRRELTIDNIRNAFPEKSMEEIIEIAKESYRTMGKMIMTSIYLGEITSNGNTVVENEELIRNLCENNEKAVIIVSLHLGGFEAGSIMKSIRKFYAVFRKQKNRKLNDLMTLWRKEGGLNSIPLRNSDALNSALNNRTLIALASDHYASDVEIEYFGRKTKGVSGPVLLGLKHKVPLILSYAVFEGDKIRIVNKKEIKIEKKENLKSTIRHNMQNIFHEFEEIIREYPGQYMWQHKRWREE